MRRPGDPHRVIHHPADLPLSWAMVPHWGPMRDLPASFPSNTMVAAVRSSRPRGVDQWQQHQASNPLISPRPGNQPHRAAAPARFASRPPQNSCPIGPFRRRCRRTKPSVRRDRSRRATPAHPAGSAPSRPSAPSIGRSPASGSLPGAHAAWPIASSFRWPENARGGDALRRSRPPRTTVRASIATPSPRAGKDGIAAMTVSAACRRRSAAVSFLASPGGRRVGSNSGRQLPVFFAARTRRTAN